MHAAGKAPYRYIIPKSGSIRKYYTSLPYLIQNSIFVPAVSEFSALVFVFNNMSMDNFTPFEHPYPIRRKYSDKVAYFSMEFAIDQSLKTFSGGLGFLAGSHMRSAYALRQNMIGIGILWKYGYYDQVRRPDQAMDVLYQEKVYNFLEDTGITFEIPVNHHKVKVKAWYLHPEVFGTVPLFFLSTDLPENDFLARTICHRLYDSNVSTKIAQYILLGIGGQRLLEELRWNPDTYHLNEAHGLPLVFELYRKLGSVDAVKEKLVFTTHTPVPAGNEVHNVDMLEDMSYFDGLTTEQIHRVARITDNRCNLTLNGLSFARIANAVSAMHGNVARKMWSGYDNICDITHITNAQSYNYWADQELAEYLDKKDNDRLILRKKTLKNRLFKRVADQCGKHFDPDVLTIVWARRFAAYKRADLLTKDMEQFERLVTDTKMPVQIIWAGKPYPEDQGAKDVFNKLVYLSKQYSNCAVMTGYELHLSRLLKQGADIWLNTPRIEMEASGTSGMTAAMNGAVNFSIPDGWIPEFARHGENCFLIDAANTGLPDYEKDWTDLREMYRVINQEILPMYYKRPEKWMEVVRQSMEDILPFFDSDRMADEYYKKMYKKKKSEVQKTNTPGPFYAKKK